MTLHSDLFQGDKLLEAAAVADRAHIVPGAIGPHVGKIQLALTILDGAAISTHEVPAKLYGPSTAQCVLAYKRKRQIINRSYQTQADNIVGRMTIASLDQEMADWRIAHKRCGCNYGPLGAPQHHLLFLALVPANGIVSAATTNNSQQTPLDAALAAVPAAMAMRNKARDALSTVIDNFGSAGAVLGTQALGVHYKVSARADVIATAQKLRNDLAQIAGRLLSARAWLRSGGSGGAFAETPEPRDGHTYILPSYLVAGPLMRPLILIHEAFHDLDGFNQDFGRNPANDNGAAYHQNDLTTQLTNAYAMSQFVLHINVGRERFLHDTE